MESANNWLALFIFVYQSVARYFPGIVDMQNEYNGAYINLSLKPIKLSDRSDAHVAICSLRRDVGVAPIFLNSLNLTANVP